MAKGPHVLMAMFQGGGNILQLLPIAARAIGRGAGLPIPADVPPQRIQESMQRVVPDSPSQQAAHQDGRGGRGAGGRRRDRLTDGGAPGAFCRVRSRAPSPCVERIGGTSRPIVLSGYTSQPSSGRATETRDPWPEDHQMCGHLDEAAHAIVHSAALVGRGSGPWPPGRQTPWPEGQHVSCWHPHDLRLQCVVGADAGYRRHHCDTSVGCRGTDCGRAQHDQFCLLRCRRYRRLWPNP